MKEELKIEKIYIGGWFQRTMLHLTEIYDFLREGTSQLKLDKKKLIELHNAIDIKDIHFAVDGFEYIEFNTNSGINVSIDEDGLIVLSNKVTSKETLTSEINELTNFYEEKFSPAISYIFSLGAPVPKELANIQTVYPYFVVLNNATNEEIMSLLSQNDKQKYFKYENDSLNVVRGNKFYFINTKNKKAEEKVQMYIEEQIFIREFKGQLHRYLNLHRILWERIDTIKERTKVKGKDILEFSSKIEDYAKTINLIDSRINQMGTYLRTREKIAKNDEDFKVFSNIMEYRYETLGDTLAYIQQIWSMTKNYVNSAKALFSDLSQEVTQKSVENLTVVTSMGVGASLIGLFGETSLPSFTFFGVIYFFGLALLGYSVSKLMKYIGAKRNYEIADKEYEQIK